MIRVVQGSLTLPIAEVPETYFFFAALLLIPYPCIYFIFNYYKSPVCTITILCHSIAATRLDTFHHYSHKYIYCYLTNVVLFVIRVDIYFSFVTTMPTLLPFATSFAKLFTFYANFHALYLHENRMVVLYDYSTTIEFNSISRLINILRNIISEPHAPSLSGLDYEVLYQLKNLNYLRYK